MLFLVDHQGVPSVARWVHLTGGKTLSHEPAFIKEMLDMRMTGREIPVPGTLGMDHDRHLPPKDQQHEQGSGKAEPPASQKKDKQKVEKRGKSKK